ncbi:MAG: manganese efflux pump [Bacteroidales bacterium]|nr:manganese efflux pump [Candidatus Colicola coprequi]
MNILTIILISVGLAMDCFAVSVAKGLAVDVHEVFAKRQHPWLMAVLFGLFQGLMPLMGYYAGTLFSNFFNQYSGIIALVLLGYIGGKMVWEGCHKTATLTDRPNDFSLKTLFVLAVATSIDALATGVIFIPVPHVLWLAIAIIALTSFLFSLMGYLIGVYVGQRFHFNVELLGGIILVTIGLKIFIEGVFL